VQYPEVETFTARSIKVTSDQPKILAPDGELVGTTPAEITCLHLALDVFC
jgi:diacylglycerol kinase family enzyme